MKTCLNLWLAALGCLLCAAFPNASLAQDALGSRTQQTSATHEWPAPVKKVLIPCSDGASQPAMWYCPPGDEPRPLLVGLHTWSSSYAKTSGDELYADWCISQGWAFIHPDFRGPNNTPQAMGSDRAMQDIVEAVAWAQKRTKVDASRIYLIGVSGGGYMSLMMAGRHPELWAGVSAWCGISDIAQWHKDHVKNGVPDKYGRDIEKVLGGSPDTDPGIRKEALARSPVTWLANAKMPLDINSGFYDGRKGSVPFLHGLRAFNAVAAPADKLDEAQMEQYYATQKLPAGWAQAAPDPVYGKWLPLFRKTSGNVRVTIFDGRHEIVQQAALNWLARQRKGSPAVWEVKDFVKLAVPGSEAGK